MSLPVAFPDAERLVVAFLTGDLGPATVGVGVPPTWKKNDPNQTPHLRVAWDGTPSFDREVLARATVRLVAYHPTTTGAKALASLALGLLCTHPGGDGISSARPLTGVLPGRDTDTGAEIASVTARVTLRSSPI